MNVGHRGYLCNPDAHQTLQAGSNTISLFSINPKTPTEISLIGNPIGSSGEFPMSLAFNADGTRLCTLNGGAVNGVACFAVDKKKGLTPIANSVRSLNLNQTTPATGPAGSASHVIFSEDGKQLMASVKGVPPTPGFIALFDVKDDGSLSSNFKKVEPPKGGALPFSMTLIPGKNAVLSTDPAVGFDVLDLNGNSSAAVKIDGQSATCWSSLSKKTGNFYLTDIGTSIVTEVKVDNNLKASIVAVRALTPLHDGGARYLSCPFCLCSNTTRPRTRRRSTTTSLPSTERSECACWPLYARSLLMRRDSSFLYVLAPNTTSIEILSLESAGNAKHISTLDISGPTKAAGITISTFSRPHFHKIRQAEPDLACYHRPAQPPGHDHLRHPVKGSSFPRTLRLIRSLGCIYLTPSALVALGLCSLLNFTLSSVSDVALVGYIHKWGSHFVIISRRASVKDLPYTVHFGTWSKVSRTRGTVVTLRPPHGVLPPHVRLDNRRHDRVPYTDNK